MEKCPRCPRHRLILRYMAATAAVLAGASAFVGSVAGLLTAF